LLIQVPYINRIVMEKYKIIKKGVFQSVSSFEEKVNTLSADGWKAISLTSDNSHMYVLMERER